MKTSLHKLLIRQLHRLGMNEDTTPKELSQWQTLLQSINRTYNESDQERYLLERSMDISSREMQALNDKLESAQHLARLGYWYHDRVKRENLWSKELYRMFGLENGKPAPSIELVITLIHDDDRPLVEESIRKAFTDGEKYEFEIRMRAVNEIDNYKWYHIIGNPVLEADGSVNKLSGIAMDVTSRKKAEEELQYLHQQLVISARRAGMADVATSILHNVGNVLNSASVSVELLNEYAKCQHFEKLFATGRLLKENKSDLSEYLYGDNKGRLIPLYILTLTERLKDIQESIADEVKNLSKHIRHIKDITAMQQSLGTVTVASEKIFVPEIIDTAFSMCGDIFKNNRIKIKKNYDEQFFLTTDKAKLLQILVNLLQNSRDALTMGGEGRSRLLSLSVKKSGDDNVDIIVQDNGIGISQEVLTRIFAFGYTTKKDGHGFGLHSSALAAKDLGGSLTAESDGINQGARFILNLPIKIASRRNANVPEQKLAYHCD